MIDSDLEIVNLSRRSPFDFSVPEYDRQLAAGYSKNTPTQGLIACMADFAAVSGREL